MTHRKIVKIEPGGNTVGEEVLLVVDEYYTTLALKGYVSFRAVGRIYDVAWV
jgi:hypothetical protein